MSPARALPVPAWALGLGLFAFSAVVFHFRILTPGTDRALLGSDLHLYYLPTYELFYGRLRGGELPLWNPFQICGVPQVASLQGGFFYPFHLVYLFLPPIPGWWLSVVAHLTLVGAGMAWFVRRLGLGMGAAIAAGVFLALRGRYPWMTLFPNLLEAAAWLPVGAVAVEAMARDGRARHVAALAACAGLSLLAGYPQGSVYVVYSWGALLLLLLVVRRADARTWTRGSVLLVAAVAIGGAVAAAQLLPSWELTGQGTRSPGPLTRGEQFPLGWHGPGFLDAFYPTLKAPFPDLYLSFGWTALAGLAAALFARRHRALAFASLGFAFVALCFAMGPATPLFDWISKLPAIGWFRFPRRALFMVDFFAAIPFAVGVQGLLDLAAERVPALGRPAGAWLGLVPAALLLAEILVAPGNEDRVQVGLMEHYRRDGPLYQRIAESGERAWLRSPSLESRHLPKLASYRRFKSVGDYEPVNQRRQSEYFNYLMEGQLAPAKKGRPYSGRLKHLTAPKHPEALARRGRLLDVAAVHWFVVQRPALARRELRRYAKQVGLVEERDLRDPDFALLRNPNAVPRAFVTYEVREAPDPETLMETMSRRGFDPLRYSFAEGARLESPRARSGHAARIAVDEATRVEVEAELEQPGMLVLVDSWFPGWEARVAGEALEIHPVNHLFRGVLLPAGRHRVVFEYRPWTVPTGGLASGAGVAAILLLWVLGRRADELPVQGRSDSIPPDEEAGSPA